MGANMQPSSCPFPRAVVSSKYRIWVASGLTMGANQGFNKVVALIPGLRQQALQARAGSSIFWIEIIAPRILMRLSRFLDRFI